MSTTLPSLAVEMVELLASFLGRTDSSSLRLVCWELYTKTLQHFTRTYMATVKTDLTPQSLQRLRDISRSEHLAHRVKLLRIIPKGLYFGQGFQWDRHPSGHLNLPVAGVDLLQSILVHNLVNCRSFDVSGLDEVDQKESTEALAAGDAIGIILAIVSETGLAIQSLTVQASGRLATRRITVPLSRPETFIIGWTHLEELILDCKITIDQQDWLVNLISHAPRLRKLSLTFDFGLSSHIDSLLERFASARLCPQLEELSLSYAHVTAKIFCHFISRCSATIRALSLDSVTLEDGGTWNSTLKHLSGKLPRLNSFYVIFLLHTLPGEDAYVIFDKLTAIPVVPGSEHLVSGYRTHDSRLLPVLKHPMELTYWFSRRNVLAVTYTGPDADIFLHVLGEAAELGQRVNRF